MLDGCRWASATYNWGLDILDHNLMDERSNRNGTAGLVRNGRDDQFLWGTISVDTVADLDVFPFQHQVSCINPALALML